MKFILSVNFSCATPTISKRLGRRIISFVDFFFFTHDNKGLNAQ